MYNAHTRLNARRKSQASGWPSSVSRWAILALCLPSLAWGATIQVETTAASSTTECTLADAIATANSGTDVNACELVGSGDPVIELEGATYDTTGVLPFEIDSGVRMTIQGDIAGIDAAILRDASQPWRRLFKVSGELSLKGVVLTGGTTGFQNAAVRVASSGILNLFRCRVENHQGTTRGGGILSFGTLAIEDCTLDSNSAPDGGAIYLAGGSADISGSTCVGNSATGDGGAIVVDGDSVLTIENSTFSSNDAAWGGALAVVQGQASVDMSTFKDNTSDAFGSALAVESLPATNILSVQRSALDRDPISDGCANDPSCTPVPLCDGSVASNGNNAAEDSSCGLGPQETVTDNLYLSDLVDHHGLFTPVHVPQCPPVAGSCPSPLMEQYICDAAVVKDQRSWFARNTNYNGIITGALCDIGAYESVYTLSLPAGIHEIELRLWGYQTASGPTSTRILDNGAGPGHHFSFPNAQVSNCRIDWVAPAPGVLHLNDVIFVTETCSLDCFEDPAGCAAQCEGSDPTGWIADDLDPAFVPSTEFGFDVPCSTDVSTHELSTIIVEYYHQDDAAAFASGDLSVLRHWDPVNPVEECSDIVC